MSSLTRTIIAFIVPDGDKRAKTIREPSHKVALTKNIIEQLMGKLMRYTIIKLESVSGIEERRASIICVAQKR